MAARRLPLLPPDAGSDDTAPPGVQPISAAEAASPAAVARSDLVLAEAGGAVPEAGNRCKVPAGRGCDGFPASAARRHPRESRQTGLGGALSPTAGLAFTVLIERLPAQCQS